jgi:hypothetical protein
MKPDLRDVQRRSAAARAGHVRAVEIPGCGHALALMDTAQIALVREFLLDSGTRASTPSRRGARAQPGATP